MHAYGVSRYDSDERFSRRASHSRRSRRARQRARLIAHRASRARARAELLSL